MARGLHKLYAVLFIVAGLLIAAAGLREYLNPFIFQYTQGQNWSHSTQETIAPESIRQQLNTDIKHGFALARLSVPRLDRALYVVEGDDDNALRRGPGHMPGTALPGAKGNCIVAGHRDTQFRFLKDIEKGDDIVLETHWGTYHYWVKNVSVVSPKDTRCLRSSSTAELHLITCYPFYYMGSAPKRFVVEATLGDPPSADMTASQP